MKPYSKLNDFPSLQQILAMPILHAVNQPLPTLYNRVCLCISNPLGEAKLPPLLTGVGSSSTA